VPTRGVSGGEAEDVEAPVAAQGVGGGEAPEAAGGVGGGEAPAAAGGLAAAKLTAAAGGVGGGEGQGARCLGACRCGRRAPCLQGRVRDDSSGGRRRPDWDGGLIGTAAASSASRASCVVRCASEQLRWDRV
jgi:hypothetical protein